MKDLAENLFPDTETNQPNQDSNFMSLEQVVVKIPGRQHCCCSFTCRRSIQWPLTRDETAVKLDESHYFFTLRVPSEANDEDQENLLNYGLTIASKGQEKRNGGWRRRMFHLKKKEDMERSSAAYWTTLAPNVEDYSSSIARLIAVGSGQLVKGILWCGDVTVDRLKWRNDVLIKRMGKGSNSEISPEAMRRMKRVKKMTKMSEKVATGILSGVVKVSGFFTSPIINSKAGQKFFSLLPGEIVLASLDGFNKVCDAVEVAGNYVMSTTSVVTTGLVQQRHGDQAAQMTHEGFDAAGHSMGTAWAVFKIRKTLNPKGAIKPITLAKAAAQANLANLKSKQK
ncbi:hypothetical protein K7X08_037112 [Anisodus acutangulus]|uniref:Senescence domain-containing protein n=1 Tax=Anisodus acutangulus TaxID=402998 RepID=A0A9Q1QYQ8_9SOLA|nr:hypothetical protein K7X08_037112 [Anisodus acutangulus]